MSISREDLLAAAEDDCNRRLFELVAKHVSVTCNMLTRLGLHRELARPLEFIGRHVMSKCEPIFVVPLLQPSFEARCSTM